MIVERIIEISEPEEEIFIEKAVEISETEEEEDEWVKSNKITHTKRIVNNKREVSETEDEKLSFSYKTSDGLETKKKQGQKKGKMIKIDQLLVPSFRKEKNLKTQKTKRRRSSRLSSKSQVNYCEENEKYSDEEKNTEEKLYIIEKIILNRGEWMLVKWKGYSSDENSWINKKDIVTTK